MACERPIREGGISVRLSVPFERPIQDKVIQRDAAQASFPSAVTSQAPCKLRPPNAGDLGWIVHRHGALYATEHGYDQRFEGLVAGVVASFAANYDSARERCWIAEADGTIVGSVFLVRNSESVASLRLLYLEPDARGRGIGALLVDECIRFARTAGYTTIRLWTQRSLTVARRLYEARGFLLVGEEPHRMFGPDLVAETWVLTL